MRILGNRWSFILTQLGGRFSHSGNFTDLARCPSSNSSWTTETIPHSFIWFKKTRDQSGRQSWWNKQSSKSIGTYFVCVLHRIFCRRDFLQPMMWELACSCGAGPQQCGGWCSKREGKARGGRWNSKKDRSLWFVVGLVQDRPTSSRLLSRRTFYMVTFGPSTGPWTRLLCFLTHLPSLTYHIHLSQVHLLTLLHCFTLFWRWFSPKQQLLRVVFFRRNSLFTTFVCKCSTCFWSQSTSFI